MASRTCLFCFKSIEGSHYNRRFCSKSCLYKYKWKYRKPINHLKKQRAYYARYVLKQTARDRINSSANKRRKQIKNFLNEYKQKSGCIDCGYNKHPAALDFDHLYDKQFNVCYAKSIKQAEHEILKCQVVCSNCHRIRTYNRVHGLNNY